MLPNIYVLLPQSILYTFLCRYNVLPVLSLYFYYISLMKYSFSVLNVSRNLYIYLITIITLLFCKYYIYICLFALILVFG